jgi:hypothetical protein
MLTFPLLHVNIFEMSNSIYVASYLKHLMLRVGNLTVVRCPKVLILLKLEEIATALKSSL